MFPKTLVIDSNQIISSLVRDSITRKILLNPKMVFKDPDYLFHELEKYKNMIIKKSRLTLLEYDFVFREIFSRIEIIPFEEILPWLDETRTIIQAEQKIKGVKTRNDVV